MKQVQVISKKIPSKPRSQYQTGLGQTIISGGGGGSDIDLSPYMLLSRWLENFEEKTDADGTPYLLAKKSLVSVGGLTAYAGESVDVPSIFDDIPIDNDTIYWDESTGVRVLKAKGGGGEAGSVAWENVTNKPSWIGSTKPSYVWSEIGNKPTTLGGYGITDAYTKTDSDNRFASKEHNHPYLPYQDTRNENYNPYDNNFNERGLSATHLKTNTADGLNDGGMYHTSVYLYPWGDSSGGAVHNLAFTDNGNMWLRSGTSSWNSWKKLAFTTDNVASATNADKVDNYHAGNSSGQVAVSNGTTCTNLNADKLDGYHESSFSQRNDFSFTNNINVKDWVKSNSATQRAGNMFSVSGWAWASSSTLVLSSSISIDRMRYSALSIRNGNLNSSWQQQAILFIPTIYENNMIYLAQMRTEGTAGSVYTSIKRYADYDTILKGDDAYEKLKVNGYVGLGISSPSYRLDVASDIRVNGWLRTTGNVGWYSETHGGGWYMTDSDFIRSYNNKGVVAHRFVAEGYAGTSWNYGYGVFAAKIVNNDHQTPLLLAYRSTTTDTGANRLFALELLNNGNSIRFSMGGSVQMEIFKGDNITVYTNILSKGGITCYSSDQRAKTVIEQISLSLKQIANAPTIRFKWNNWKIKDDGKTHIGGIAQYMQKLLPETVLEADGVLNLDYSTTGYIFAVQTARHLQTYETRTDRKIRKLEKEVLYLKNQLKKLGYEEADIISD